MYLPIKSNFIVLGPMAYVFRFIKLMAGFVFRKGLISIYMYVCLAEVGANPEILRNISYEICVTRAILGGMARVAPVRKKWDGKEIELMARRYT